MSPFGKLQTFSRHDYTYIMYDMHMNNIQMHSHLVVDMNKEGNTKYSYKTDTTGDSDRQIMTE